MFSNFKMGVSGLGYGERQALIKAQIENLKAFNQELWDQIKDFERKTIIYDIKLKDLYLGRFGPLSDPNVIAQVKDAKRKSQQAYFDNEAFSAPIYDKIKMNDDKIRYLLSL